MLITMTVGRHGAAVAALLAGALAAGCGDAPTTPAAAGAGEPMASVGTPRAGFRFTIVDVPGAMWTAVMRMNARGDFVGGYRDADGTHGFVARGEGYEAVDYPGATATMARGINERGTIVGSYVAAGRTNGFVLADGAYATLNVPDANQTALWDVAANGVISGEYQAVAGGAWHAFVWRDGEFDRIAIPGATMSAGFGVNLRGEVVGHYRLADPASPTGATKMFGFVWRKGEVTQLDYPVPNGMSCAQGIGDQGAAVGHYADLATGIVHAYVWRNGTFVSTFRVPEALQTYPLTITPSGTIAGYHIDAAGAQHGFVAEPSDQSGR